MSRLTQVLIQQVEPTEASTDCEINPRPRLSVGPRKPSQRDLENLIALGLYYIEPEHAVLCIRCGFALKADADRDSHHLGEKHVSEGQLRALEADPKPECITKDDVVNHIESLHCQFSGRILDERLTIFRARYHLNPHGRPWATLESSTNTALKSAC